MKKDRVIRKQLKIRKNQVSEDIHKLFQGILLLELLNDVITSLFMVVPYADQEFVLEGFEVLVLAKQSLLPKDVNFVVNIADDFFKGAVV